MSKFDNISKTKKENFVANLTGITSYFNKAKTALINFDDFMQNNPKSIGLSTASIIAIGALGYDTFKHEFEDKVSLNMYQPVADVKLRNTQITDEFLRVPAESSKIKNINY